MDFFFLSLLSLKEKNNKKEKDIFITFHLPVFQCRCPVIYAVVFCTIITLGAVLCLTLSERKKSLLGKMSDFRWKREDYPTRQQRNNINENGFFSFYSVLSHFRLGFVNAKPKQIPIFFLAHSATQITNFLSYVFRRNMHARHLKCFFLLLHNIKPTTSKK